jgi:hypothetical protein
MCPLLNISLFKEIRILRAMLVFASNRFVERNFYLIPGKRFRSIRPIAEFNGIPGIAVTFIVPIWPRLSVQQAVGSQRKKFE